MTAPDLIGLFIGPLERIGVPYMITGGVASVIYGDPRFTRDIDVVLEFRRQDIPRLAAEFQGGDFYVPSVEVLEVEAARPQGGHFNVIHRDTALRADIYKSDRHLRDIARMLRISGEILDAEALGETSRRRTMAHTRPAGE